MLKQTWKWPPTLRYAYHLVMKVLKLLQIFWLDIAKTACLIIPLSSVSVYRVSANQYMNTCLYYS